MARHQISSADYVSSRANNVNVSSKVFCGIHLRTITHLVLKISINNINRKSHNKNHYHLHTSPGPMSFSYCSRWSTFDLYFYMILWYWDHKQVLVRIQQRQPEHVWDMWHPLASLDQYTSSMLNDVSSVQNDMVKVHKETDRQSEAGNDNIPLGWNAKG